MDYKGAGPVWRGVSKGVVDDRKLPALWADHPKNGHKAVSGVARSLGVEGSGRTQAGRPIYLLQMTTISKQFELEG